MMGDDVKPSSSEDIIASLINEVQQSKQPFDVTSILPVRTKDQSKGSKSRSRSSSLKPENKEKKRRDKKLKKSKKWKRTPSRSPSRKRKKRRASSRSTSQEDSRAKEEAISTLDAKLLAKPCLERISDDDDDLPVGADFRTLSSSGNAKVPECICKQKPSSPDLNKRREFVWSEEVFPLSKPRKKKERSESPPMQKNVRPLSEILAKVRAEKSSSFVPRNVKLKQEGVKSFTGGNRVGGSTNGRSENSFENECEEYGPLPAPKPSGPLPISEDDEEEATFSGKHNPLHLKSVRLGSVDEAAAGKKGGKQLFMEHNGEVPVSDDSFAENDDSAFNDEALKEEDDKEDKKLFRKAKHEKKRRKEKKKRKKEKERKKKHTEQPSSSSDSEKEWERLRKRQKMHFEAVSPRITNFRYVAGAGDYRSVKRRGDGFEPVVNSRNARDRRFWNQGENLWRLDNRRQLKERKRCYRRRSFSSLERKRSKTKSKSRSRSRNHSSSTSRRSSRSRSDTRSHCSSSNDKSSNEHKIDKKKLLEIAQKNAAQMAQLGYLPNAANEVGPLKGGMQSVDQLVDFCQKLQRSQEQVDKAAAERISSDDDGVLLKKKKPEESLELVKHPFALKSSAPITINITNAAPLPIKTPSQRAMEETQLRLCYPVSSGQQHREKDNQWVPVKKDLGEDKKKNASAVGKHGKESADPSTSFLLPPPPKPPVLLPHSSSAPSSLLTLPPPPLPPPNLMNLININNSTEFSKNTVPATNSKDLVFREPEVKTPTENLGKFLAQRLEASKRLGENPNDFDALKMLKEAEEQASFIFQEINDWATSKSLPGKFSGSTGANILSADQLGPEDPRFSAWARKDLFKVANRVQSDVGLKLMQKMGWSPGEGLGKGRDGLLEPLVLDVKSDRKGLVAAEDLVFINKSNNAGCSTNGKHPVSILMELCTKKKWPAPHFTCIESGPSNNRRFLWKTVVNGVEYRPALPSNNKKTGKALACQVVLQALGLVSEESSFSVI